MPSQDMRFMQMAIDMALVSESEGNLPIGSVIILDGEVISSGRNRIFLPEYHPLNHAEIMAIRDLDKTKLKGRSKDMTLYTNVEPCVMCIGAIIIHRIGRVVFGAKDLNRGGTFLLNHMETIYRKEQLPRVEGPIAEDMCGEMFARADRIYRARIGEDDNLKEGARAKAEAGFLSIKSKPLRAD
jgi:tRNA(adenine34) deaminase